MVLNPNWNGLLPGLASEGYFLSPCGRDDLFVYFFLLMPTALVDLPGYPGQEHLQVFAQDHVWGVGGGGQPEDTQLLAEINRRVGELSPDQLPP